MLDYGPDDTEYNVEFKTNVKGQFKEQVYSTACGVRTVPDNMCVDRNSGALLTVPLLRTQPGWAAA